MIRVDDKTFNWMGAPKDIAKATQTSAEYTSTKSIFTPKDLKRQSLIFSYMQVEVSSIDGSEHKVQIYTDISAGALS
jgi:hypothetical protein